MPKPTKGPRLGGTPAHERIILANLASQLFEHGRITTTETKAKRVRPLAERLISKAKRGDLHNRRLVLSTITDKSVVHALFAEIAPAMEGRDGGYTRITKVGPRKGDNAPMAVLELITEPVVKKTKPVKADESAQDAKAKIAAAAADEVEVDEVEVDEVEDEATEATDQTEAAEQTESSEAADEVDAVEDVKA